MANEEWGPWIEHDGNECPCVGAFVHSIFNGYGVYQLTGNRTNEVFAVATGNPEAWVHSLRPDLFLKVTRYRIRKPRGLTILEELLEGLPALEREGVDA